MQRSRKPSWRGNLWWCWRIRLRVLRGRKVGGLGRTKMCLGKNGSDEAGVWLYIYRLLDRYPRVIPGYISAERTAKVPYSQSYPTLSSSHKTLLGESTPVPLQTCTCEGQCKLFLKEVKYPESLRAPVQLSYQIGPLYSRGPIASRPASKPGLSCITRC